MARPRTIKTPTAPPVLRAFLYARVSSKEQEEGFSLEAQLGLLRGYALAKGFHVVQEFVEAETAKQAGRKAFSDMVSLCRAGKASVIVTEKTDRIYRNLKDRVTIDELGVELHLVKENTVISKDSRSHEKFIHDIKLVVAKNYCDNLSEEARKGMLEKARQGFYPSKASVGYRNVTRDGRKLIEPDPVEAPIVQELFSAYAAGRFSLKGSGAYALSLGLKPKQGGTFRACTIQWLLRNPVYYGIVRWNNEEFEGKHTPLISKGLFDRCQEVMTGRTTSKIAIDSEFAYRGVFTCGLCGCSMSPYIAKGKYTYYACTNAKGGCKRRGVREELLTAAVAEKLQGLCIEPAQMGWLRDLLKEMLEEQSRDHDEATTMLQKRQADLQGKKRRAYLDNVEGKIPADTYAELMAEWEKELKEIGTALNTFELAQNRHYDENLKLIELASKAHDLFHKADSGEKRKLLKYLLANSTITDGIVQVQLKTWFNSLFEINQIDRENTPKATWWAQLDSN